MKCLLTRSFLFLEARILLTIDEELQKDGHIQKERSKAAKQPRGVDGHISKVYGLRFTGATTAGHATHGREGDDGEHVREVSDAGEDEEQHRHTLGGLAPEVQEDLREAAAEIQERAEIPEYLAERVEAQNVLLRSIPFVRSVVVMRPSTGVHAEPPPKYAGAAHEQYGDEVPDCCFQGARRPEVADGGRIRGFGWFEKGRDG